jgi:DNA mismatch repair ATPase MutS
MAQNPNNTSAYHFQTHIGDDGNISFDYKKREGHERSHALLVAKKMGMPDEILQLAQMI